MGEVESVSLPAAPQNESPIITDAASVTAPILQASPAYLILSLVLSLFAIAPLFYPGYIQTHSGLAPWWNVADLRTNLGDWTWLPHIATHFDPLRSDGLWPYYLAAIWPSEPLVAIKVVLGLAWLLGTAGMFGWLKNWLGRPGAVVAALVYTYLPYRIATVYVRGAWGEAFFWGLLPWAILTASESTKQPNSASSRKAQLAYACLAACIWLILGLSQLGLALWAFVLVNLLLLMTYPRRAVWPIAASFGGVVLATFITLAISAASSASPSTLIPFSDHFLYPFQLLSAYWGFGPSRPGWNDGMSFQLGLAAIGLTILSLILWRRRKSTAAETRQTERSLIFFGGVAIASILLQFDFTEPLWRLPWFPGQTLASTLTYPWQLLGLTGLGLAVLAGASLWLDEQLTRLPLFSSIIILVILSSYSYLLPQFIQIEPGMRSGPQALWGPDQLALLSHHFSVDINGNTAGLDRGPTTIPLAAHGPLQANQVLRLNVTWQPLQAFAADWKVFVHLVDANGRVLAQFDGQPLEGSYPTSRWIPGELIKDSYPLLLPADASPGPYRVLLGLYNEASGARLPVPADAEGKVVLHVE